MPTIRKRKVIIVGAGPAGLAAAVEFGKAGVEALVLEQSALVGGLSATLSHDGFRYDIGGHRFFTRNADVKRYVLSLLGGRALTVDRRSRIHYQGKFFDYPLSIVNALSGMGARRSMLAAVSFAAARVKDFLPSDDRVSFEEFMVARFGRKLYETFFEGYTRKVWGVPCSQLSSDWASQRIRGLNLMVALRNALRPSRGGPRTLVSQFMYPAGGIGELSEAMALESESLGGVVRSGTCVTGLEVDGEKVAELITESGERLQADWFVFTNPLTQVGSWLARTRLDVSGLRFRGLVTVLLELDMPRMTGDHWLYFPDVEIPFGRIHEPKNWSPEMAPPNATAVVAEYFAFPGDEVWVEDDRALIRRTADVLGQLGFISQKALIGGKVDRWPFAYPAYFLGYKQRVDSAHKAVRSLANAVVAGRTGLFRYHNVDHAIETGWEAARALLSGNGDPFRVNQDTEYQEGE